MFVILDVKQMRDKGQYIIGSGQLKRKKNMIPIYMIINTIIDRTMKNYMIYKSQD